MTYVVPPMSNLDAIIAVSRSIERGTTIPVQTNDKIAALLGVPADDYSGSMDSALRLRDIIFAGYDYVNLDMREYDDKRGLVFMLKIETQYGEASGDHHTRPGALLDALLTHVIYEMES